MLFGSRMHHRALLIHLHALEMSHLVYPARQFIGCNVYIPFSKRIIRAAESPILYVLLFLSTQASPQDIPQHLSYDTLLRSFNMI